MSIVSGPLIWMGAGVLMEIWVKRSRVLAASGQDPEGHPLPDSFEVGRSVGVFHQPDDPNGQRPGPRKRLGTGGA